MTPERCIGTAWSSRASTPSSPSARSMREFVGRPPGDPTTRCTIAAASRPTAAVAIAPPIASAPSSIEPTTAAPMSHRPRCRNGRVRYGDATAIAALGDGDGARRERGRTVEAHEPPRRAPGAAGDEHVQAERGEPSEGHPGRHRGEQHHAVTRRGDHDQRQRPPERRPDQGRPQRLEEIRQRRGQRRGGSADVARHRVQHAHQHDDEGGEDRQRDVGGTPGQRLVRARREQQQATGTPTRQWRGGHGGRSRRAGHRSGS